MKIVVLTGSPRKNGGSNYLAERFLDGARESEHEVVRFDCAAKNVHPCIACDRCADGACVFEDDMSGIMEKLLEADMVVFASPTYYFGLSAQLKAVIDRFYGRNAALMERKKTALLLTAGGAYERNLEGVVLQFEIMAEYLQWQNVGTVLAPECSSRADAAETDAPERAYSLGKHCGEM